MTKTKENETNSFKGVPMELFDITFNFGTFADTSATFEAVSDKGRAFIASLLGSAAVGGTLPKTRGNDLMIFAQRKGLTCQSLAS